MIFDEEPEQIQQLKNYQFMMLQKKLNEENHPPEEESQPKSRLARAFRLDSYSKQCNYLTFGVIAVVVLIAIMMLKSY